MINDFLNDLKKIQNKYLNLNDMIGGDRKIETLPKIYYNRVPNEEEIHEDGILKVKLNETLISAKLYKNFHFGMIYQVIRINKDSTLNLQGLKQAVNINKEPRLINLRNVPNEHTIIIEDGKSIVELYPRNIPSSENSKCIIIYFSESDRPKIKKMVTQLFPTSINSIEADLHKILFDVLSIDDKYCEIKHKQFYFGRFPTQYLMFGKQYKKN